jgi:hypothetical protein
MTMSMTNEHILDHGHDIYNHDHVNNMTLNMNNIMVLINMNINMPRKHSNK